MRCIECDGPILRIEDATDEVPIRASGRLPIYSIHRSCEGRGAKRAYPNRRPDALDDIERRRRN